MPVRLQTHGAVATLSLDAPGKRNALGLADWSDLSRSLEQVRRDGAAVLVLASAHPGVFCAGLDLDEVKAASADAKRAEALYDAMTDALDALERSPAVTVAVVDGAAVGAGCALAMACDMRFVGPHAAFRTPPAHLGLIYPAADVRRLVRGAGYGTSLWMLATGEAVRADRAVQIGAVIALSDDPMEQARRTAARVEQAVPGRLAAMKQAVADAGPSEAAAADDRRLFVEALISPEARARIHSARPAPAPDAVDRPGCETPPTEPLS